MRAVLPLFLAALLIQDAAAFSPSLSSLPLRTGARVCGRSAAIQSMGLRPVTSAEVKSVGSLTTGLADDQVMQWLFKAGYSSEMAASVKSALGTRDMYLGPWKEPWQATEEQAGTLSARITKAEEKKARLLTEAAACDTKVNLLVSNIPKLEAKVTEAEAEFATWGWLPIHPATAELASAKQALEYLNADIAMVQEEAEEGKAGASVMAATIKSEKAEVEQLLTQAAQTRLAAEALISNAHLAAAEKVMSEAESAPSREAAKAILAAGASALSELDITADSKASASSLRGRLYLLVGPVNSSLKVKTEKAAKPASSTGGGGMDQSAVMGLATAAAVALGAFVASGGADKVQLAMQH